MSRTSDNKELLSTIEEIKSDMLSNSFISKDTLYSSLFLIISMTLVDISQSLAVIADVMKDVEDEEEDEDES